MTSKNKHQFVHLEVFSRVPPKHTKQWSAFDASNEAWRVPKNSKHIHTPHQPELLHGVAPDTIANELNAPDEIITNTGQKLRKDAKVLMAGVASYPKLFALLSKDDGVKLHSWETATRNFYIKNIAHA